MSDQNNLPEAEDTKTRVTAKINPGTPGKNVPKIDLNTAPAVDAKSPTNTMTGRTMKLQGLAGLAANRPSVDVAPVVAAPAAAGGDDTRTRRTVKLATLAGGPAKTVDLGASIAAKPVPPASVPATAAPAAPAPVSPSVSANTVTRRTQKLEALDTKDVVAMTEAAPSADDTKTRKATKISAVAAQPSPQAINLGGAARRTVQVAAVPTPAAAPVVAAPAAPAAVAGNDASATVKLASPGENTKTQVAQKVAPAESGQFKAGNVDDTVRLQRPAPKPVMPGSVAPAAQSGAAAVGGIKLNMPKPAAKPAPKPAAKPAAAAEPAETESAEGKEAAPAGNLGKDLTPPKKKGGLKVNSDAIKDLGSSPAALGSGPQTVLGDAPVKQVKESLGINITFAIFGVLALLMMVFIALIATVDYLNIWQNKSSERIDLPIISEHVYSNINKN